MASVCKVVNTLTGALVNPALALIFAAGLLVFLFGLVEFLWGLSNEAADKQKGKDHMLWGIAGMFIMFAAWAVIQVLTKVVGGSLPCGGLYS